MPNLSIVNSSQRRFGRSFGKRTGQLAVTESVRLTGHEASVLEARQTDAQPDTLEGLGAAAGPARRTGANVGDGHLRRDLASELRRCDERAGSGVLGDPRLSGGI